MKTARLASPLGLSLMLLASPGGRCGAAETRVFTNEAGGFEITLPADWQEIPAEHVQQRTKQLIALVPSLAEAPYKMAYQRVSPDGRWFVYPDMLVQFNEHGPVREEEFSRAVHAHDEIEKGMKKATDEAGSILKDSGATIPTYDPQKHLMRFGTHAQLANGVEVTGISAVFLTSRGTLAFHFYARKADFDGFKDDFESAIDSVKLSNALEYKPPPSPYAKFYRTLIFAAVGACAGVAIAIVRRRSARTPPPLPPSYTA